MLTGEGEWERTLNAPLRLSPARDARPGGGRLTFPAGYFVM
jgi:hypothetical protein